MRSARKRGCGRKRSGQNKGFSSERNEGKTSVPCQWLAGWTAGGHAAKLRKNGDASLMQINTTAGKITPDQLGRTLVHEHVLAGYPGWFMDTRLPPFRRADAISRVVDSFQRLHAYGVRTVIDPCPTDLGRDVEFVAEISQRSGITLICHNGRVHRSLRYPLHVPLP